jgi:hypothetical protein
LFDVPLANCTAFYADGQKDKESEEEDAQADPDADVPENMAVHGTATGTATLTKKKKISKRTSGYTLKEDVCLCRSWLAISQETISGAELKGKAYWRRVTVDYHERQQLKPFKIHSDYGEVSIQKRWSLIQQETNKFCRRPKSGTDVIEWSPYVICPCAMPIENVCCMRVSGLHFILFVGSSCLGQTTHEGKSYNLVNCWRVLKAFEKYRGASYKKSLMNGKTPTTVDLE